MFSNWFSGDECGQYRTSPHKQRMDHVGSSLLELRYANEVIRQHLHEWLRFSRHLKERGDQVAIIWEGDWLQMPTRYGSTSPGARRRRVPAAPAFSEPLSEFSSTQTNEDSFADVLVLLL